MGASAESSAVIQRILRCRVKPLHHPDKIHHQAAQGWLELSQYGEANKECEKALRNYERIDFAYYYHPRTAGETAKCEHLFNSS